MWNKYFDNPVLLDLRATIVVGVSGIIFGVDTEVNGDDYYYCFYYNCCWMTIFSMLFLLCAQLPVARKVNLRALT